jgi:transcriptional regulator with PAS, ATPase and Fis domain
MPKSQPFQDNKKKVFDLSAEADPARSVPPASVLVWDQLQQRLRLISDIIAECGARPLFIEKPSTIPMTLRAMECPIVLAAVGAQPESDGPSAEALRILKLKGFKIIAYEDGVLSWPIGVQCQALLMGASWLLDSSQSNFAEKLRRFLSQLLRDEAGRNEADRKIKGEMERLGLVGASLSMLSVFHRAVRAAGLSDLATLITGETGTGKELIARAIHQLDLKRRNGPFIPVNCSSINPGIAESELFGHRRGSFTGAERDRQGLLRSANGGVLFLDEIGEMELVLQAKLLRALQENRVLGVGEDRETAINVRVIAATNRDLKELTRAGGFRADLFHRLNLLSIHIPPLRQRPADLEPLIEHFLDKNRSLQPGRRLAIGTDFLAALAMAELPGNVRQLENVIRWAIVNKSDDAPLNLSDLPREILEQVVERSRTPTSICGQGAVLTESPPSELNVYLARLLSINGWTLSQSLEYCEKLLLESALRLARGNQSQTAKLLGLTPRSVYNKVQKHQLDQ